MNYLVSLCMLLVLCSACSKGATPRNDDLLATPDEKAYNQQLREQEFKDIGDPILNATGGDSFFNNAGPP